MKATITLVFLFLLCSMQLYTQSELFEVELNPTGNQQYEGIFLTRGSGSLSLVNGTTFPGLFQPRISSWSNADLSPGLAIVGTPSLVNANSRGILLRAGEVDFLSDGNILEVSNYITPLMTINSDGFMGLGTTDAKAELHLADGDVFIEDINSGVIMKSQDGQCWRYQPDNMGQLIGTSILCPN